MIPFVDLQAQYKPLAEEIQRRLLQVLQHGQYIMGPEVKELEQKLATFTSSKHCISCSSGTDALLMALMAQGVKSGDFIFTTPFTFIATAEVIALAGATPVFVDVDSKTFNLDPARLADAIESLLARGTPPEKLRGIIAVDLFGLPADYENLQTIARKHNLFVIEDAAQSFGASLQGRRAGALAEMGCTSFFPAKPLGCYGDGGAIFTENTSLAERLISIRTHGSGTDKYEHPRVGINGRLDTMQAAILLTKLTVFEDELSKREVIAHRYSTLLEESAPFLETPRVPRGYKSAWAQYSILARSQTERDHIRNTLQQNGIPSMIYYPIPLHLQRVFAHLGYQPGSLPITEDLSKRIFSLPMHPYLSEDLQKKIISLCTSTLPQ